MIRYADTFKVKVGDKDKNDKLKYFSIDDEKYKTIQTKIENFKNIELDALLVQDDRYKNKYKNIYLSSFC